MMNYKEKYWLVKQALDFSTIEGVTGGTSGWPQGDGPNNSLAYRAGRWLNKNVAWNKKDNVYGRATAAQENWNRLSPYHDALYSSSFKDQLPARPTGNEGMLDQLGQAYDFSNLSKSRQELMANPRLYNNIEKILGTSYGEDGKLGALDPSKAQGNLDYLTWAGNQVNNLSPQGKALLGALSPGSDIPTAINMNTLANMSAKLVGASGRKGMPQASAEYR